MPRGLVFDYLRPLGVGKPVLAEYRALGTELLGIIFISLINITSLGTLCAIKVPKRALPFSIASFGH